MKSMFCVNCKREIPEIKKEFSKMKKQILPKVCINCKPQAPRQSQKSFNPKRK